MIDRGLAFLNCPRCGRDRELARALALLQGDRAGSVTIAALRERGVNAPAQAMYDLSARRPRNRPGQLHRPGRAQNVRISTPWLASRRCRALRRLARGGWRWRLTRSVLGRSSGLPSFGPGVVPRSASTSTSKRNRSLPQQLRDLGLEQCRDAADESRHRVLLSIIVRSSGSR